MSDHKKNTKKDNKFAERVAKARARMDKRRANKNRSKPKRKALQSSCKSSQCENANTDLAQSFVDQFTSGLYAQLIAAFPDSATIVIPDASGTIPFAGPYVGKSGLETLLANLAAVATPLNPPTSTTGAPNPTTGVRGETYHSCDFRKVMIQVNLAFKYNCPSAPSGPTFTEAAPAYFVHTFDNHCNLLQLEIFFNEASLIEFFTSCEN